MCIRDRSPLPRIKEMLSGCTSSMLKSVYDNIDLLEDVYNLVNDAISEDAPVSVREDVYKRQSCGS